MKKFFALFLIFFPWVLQAHAVTPMEAYNSLVAGGDDPGFRDGGFATARFNQPSGMALDDKGIRLFVADAGNNRIRVVYLDEQNRVETICGTGAAGKADGPLTQASFNIPSAVAYIPGDQLAVYDAGSGLLRLVDLKAKTVFTPKEAPQGPVWNLAYRAKDDSLYFTEPTAKLFQKMEMKGQKIMTIFSANTQVPFPRALCLEGDKLFVSDSESSAIYQVKLGNGTPAELSLEAAGKGDKVLELSTSDGRLYALQAGNTPLAEVIPDYRPVSLATPWGFCLENENIGYAPLLAFTLSRAVGFMALPGAARQFFISNPTEKVHSIISVEDYEFGKHWVASSVLDKNDPLPDFNYPASKPTKTFRILVVGDSRAVFAMTVEPGETTEKPGLDLNSHIMSSLRILSFPKQLEFLLNSRASLEGVDTHYEVLTMARPGQSTPFFMPYDVPGAAQKYGVDLVMVLAAPQDLEGFVYYFDHPLNKEGIPNYDADPEYLLKPWIKKIPEGVPKDFYEHCKLKGWVREATPTQLAFDSFGDLLALGDKEARDGLLEMTGKPFRILADKLGKIKGGDGKSPRYLIFYLPGPDHGSATEEAHELFWKDLGSQTQWPVLDLTEPFDAMKTAFYPTNENCCHFHYTAYGHSLIATILSQYLVDQKWIPFEPSNVEKKTK